MTRVVAIDWSGAQGGGRKKIWLAEVDGGRLRRLESGRTREEVTRHLLEEARRDPELVVGLDFAFSFPRWYLDRHELRSIDQLWALAAVEGEDWLKGCEPPFWGRPGRKRPDQEGLRRTELEVRNRFSSQPKSAFQIGGGGAVGTMSIRGMPYLADLREAGFHVWPFDPPQLPLVIEIYPRLLTGGLVKSDREARIRHLRGAYPELDDRQRVTAAGSEDALDAAVSAVVMWRHLDEILQLPPARDRLEELEGRIWHPEEQFPAPAGREGGTPVPISDSTRDDCPFCSLPASRVLHISSHGRAFRDAYPVSDGHTLIVPHRHVTSLWDLTAEERTGLWALVDEVREALAAACGPDGFNIGVNDGEAAGQTVSHAHIHVIPRHAGDVADPRGGIRWVVPERARYWEDGEG